MSALENPAGLLLLMSDAPHREETAGAATAALIVRARSGDLDAFDRLMAELGEMVLRTARNLVGSPADAQDAVQETFLRFYRSLDRLDAERDPAPWLYRLTLNVCRDLNRKRAWMRWLSLDALKSERSEPSPSPYHQALAGEQRRLIREGLGKLTAQERAAVVLREIEGLFAKEAAEAMGCSETTVRTHASRGRAKLRAFLEARGGGPR